MKRTATILFGFLLVAVGAVTLGYEAITYTMHPEVIDLGPLTATTDVRTDSIPLPPVLGALALVFGLVLIFFGVRRKRTSSEQKHNEQSVPG